MEIKGSIRKWTCLYEAFGTAMLVMAINWGASGPYQVICIGIAVYAGIVNLGPICGAHYNGAVTLAVYVQESLLVGWKENFTYCLQYLLAQIVGAAVGLFIVWLTLFKDKDGKWVGAKGRLCP